MIKAPRGIKILAALAVTMMGTGVAWGFGLETQFVSSCGPSHTKMDDPIVYPRKPGYSHRHQFFGARSTDAFSRPQSLRGGETSCNRERDTAAYWVPTLEVDERTVVPEMANVYYGPGGKDRGLVRPFPPGLRMIAGHAGATRPQPADRVGWQCLAPLPGASKHNYPVGWALFAGGVTQKYASKRPWCPKPEAMLVLGVRFPDCWNGRSLDSPNHRSHVRYAKPRGGLYETCPASHPVPIPKIIFDAVYATPGSQNPRNVELSSGGINSGHADFMNAWDQTELERLVRDCINAPPC
jgi:hypothetical protein